MPQLRQYHLFISHAWRYSDDYERLVNLLRDASYFECCDYSISQDKSIAPTGVYIPDVEILQAIERQIQLSSVVVVLLGMYAAYHEWMKMEMAIARAHGKKIIGIRPCSQQRIPQEARDRCNVIVGWNTASITSAIRRFSI